MPRHKVAAAVLRVRVQERLAGGVLIHCPKDRRCAGNLTTELPRPPSGVVWCASQQSGTRQHNKSLISGTTGAFRSGRRVAECSQVLSCSSVDLWNLQRRPPPPDLHTHAPVKAEGGCHSRCKTAFCAPLVPHRATETRFIADC